MNRRVIILSALLALTAALRLSAYTAQEAVDRFVSHSSLRYASVGVQVIDLDSAKSIASYRPEQANITASTMKTVVSSAALGLLGPHFRFETPVYLDGEVKDGCFTGTIVIRGLGDPTLGSVFLPYQANIVDEIISALRTRGITEVKGGIYGDDSYYTFPYHHGEWDVNDLAYGYGTAVHALNFHDNLVKVSFTMDGNGRVARSTFTPSVPGLRIISRCRGSRSRNSITPYLDYNVPALVLTGETSSKSYSPTYANPIPAPMLVDSLERALKTNGIGYVRDIDDVASYHGSERTLLVLHKSPELTEIITSLLDRSDNMFAHAVGGLGHEVAQAHAVKPPVGHHRQHVAEETHRSLIAPRQAAAVTHEQRLGVDALLLQPSLDGVNADVIKVGCRNVQSPHLPLAGADGAQQRVGKHVVAAVEQRGDDFGQLG